MLLSLAPSPLSLSARSFFFLFLSILFFFFSFFFFSFDSAASGVKVCSLHSKFSRFRRDKCILSFFFLSQVALLLFSLSLSLYFWLARNCRVSSTITDTILFLRFPCPFANNRENKQSHRLIPRPYKRADFSSVRFLPPSVKDREVFSLRRPRCFSLRFRTIQIA